MKKRTLDIMIGVFLSVFLVLVVVCCVKFGREKLGKKDPVIETQQTESYAEDEFDSEFYETEMWDTEVTEIEVEGTELSEEEIAMMESESKESEEEQESEKKESEEKESEKKDSQEKESEEKESEKDSEKQEVTKPKYPYYIKVNRRANCVTVYTYDDNGKYTVPVKAMVCSVGRNNATPTGVFRTQAKYTWRALYGGVYGQYSTRINGNVLFHSVPYRKTQKDSLITKYYNQLGTAASAGCVRLSCADAKWIYDNCSLGTTVEIYDGSSAGPLGKPSAVKIDTKSPYAGWDPTDPDPKNPWRKQGPVFAGVKDSTVERGAQIDLAANVTATDSAGKSVNVQISGQVDTKKCGTYTITYSATDGNGNTTTMKSVITVKDTVGPTIKQISDVTVYNSTTEIEKLIKSALQVIDAGETLDSSIVTLDMSKLKKAMNSKSYGTVKVDALAKDSYGNTSNVFEVKVVYAQVDENAPTITLTGNSVSASVDLTNIADENARKEKIVQAVKSAIKKGTHYTVKDDVSEEKDIVCSLSCAYAGATSAGTKDVTVTITAKDKAGKVSTKNIVVAVTVTDNTVPEDNTEEDIPSDTETELPSEKPEDTQGTESTEDTSSETQNSEDTNTETQDTQGMSEQMDDTEHTQETECMNENNEDSTEMQEVSMYRVLEIKLVA